MILKQQHMRQLMTHIYSNEILPSRASLSTQGEITSLPLENAQNRAFDGECR